ncbi:element excision factor XisI family protein [Alkalinema sp. FACHB-956]|uniref:element excision factor XisI family protein n=1 Tax=Alkalinema sp. FACHB-956 TaxID=2692768 RepID=UPI00168572BD|nr:XisI protein [Alkalinema sp. FACHB-956]
MDRVNEYRTIIQRVMADYYQLYSRSKNPDLETLLLCDGSQDQYLLMRLGWEGDRRVNRNVIHLRLRDGKVWVEEDWTEQGVATDLLAAGVEREAIVLGFQPPHVREFTEFAAV